MRKKLFVSIFVAAFILAVFTSPVIAKTSTSDQNQDIPEKNGVYDVPGKPNMKVRVFVHYPKVKETKPLQCSVNDPDSSALVGPAGWKLPAGNWNFYVNSASAPSSIGSLNFSNLANLSFDTWQGTEIKAAGVNLANAGGTTLSRKALDGKNIVTFGNAPGSALGITYIWYYPGLAVETDTILNKKFPWSWTPYSPTACPNLNTYDAQNILTHEIGHWVGLNDHYTSTYVNNTMYGYGAKGEIKKDTLTNGDIAGVDRIY